MKVKYFAILLITFLIVITLLIEVKADYMNITGGSYSGSFAVGQSVGGFNLQGNGYISNMTISEQISGANYSAGIYGGKLGYIAGLLDLPPIVNKVNLTPNQPEVNSTINCTVSATDNEGVTLTIYRDWYNATGTATLLSEFKDSETLTSRSLGESYYCRAKAYDGTQNSTDWVYSNTVFINDTIVPVISNANSAATATQNDNVNFDIDCSDGGSKVQTVTIELNDPNSQVNNATATFVSGNTYRRTVSVNIVGNWTYKSVTCKDWNNLTTLNATINRTTVVSASTGGGGDGGGGGGGVSQTALYTYAISSKAGNWTLSTSYKTGYNKYELTMTKNDKIEGRSPVVITNVGNTILDFTIFCQDLGSTDKENQNPCDFVGIETTNLTLIPSQSQSVDVTFTSGEFPNNALYSFEIIVEDNSKFQQPVTYEVTINYLTGALLKLIRNIWSLTSLFGFLLGLLLAGFIYMIMRNVKKVNRVVISAFSGILLMMAIIIIFG